MPLDLLLYPGAEGAHALNILDALIGQKLPLALSIAATLLKKSECHEGAPESFEGLGIGRLLLHG
jgi:hypothetical protein